MPVRLLSQSLSHQLGNADNPLNYRPISLLSVVSKIMERHIYIIVYLADQEFLSAAQWGGFALGNPQLQLLCQLFTTFSNSWKMFDVSLVFFDLCKAFDSVPHLPLPHKLKNIGLNQHILQWIASYLCNRQQYVVVDGASSDTTSVLSGVPQGSVLGPLLLLIHINHVSSLTLTDGSKLTMHADDILLYKPISQPEDYSGVQTHIDAIQDCISTNYLTMNPHKCKYLICSRKIHPQLPPSGLLLGGLTSKGQPCPTSSDIGIPLYAVP